MANNVRAYALSQAYADIFQAPIIAQRAPLATDKNYPLGSLWIDSPNDAAYILVSVTNNQAVWNNIVGGIFTGLNITINPGPSSFTGAFTVASAGNAVNIATDAVANATTIGNTTGASSLTLNYGTGNFVASGAATGTITLGSAAMTGNMLIGVSTAGQAISIGGAVNTGAQVISLGSGASGANSTVNILTGNGTAGTQTFNALTGTRAGVANIGTGAAAHVVTVGSTTGAASTTINAGTGGLALSAGGAVSVAPATDTQASPTATATINARVGKATFTGFTTAAAATQVFTITNSIVTATSGILVTVHNAGANDAQMTIQRVNAGAGSFVVTTKNNGAAALNGNVVITFWVID